MVTKEENPLKKVCIICAKGSIEDVYATLVMANGAVMEGIEAKVFFTFFGVDAITKKQMKKLKNNKNKAPDNIKTTNKKYKEQHNQHHHTHSQITT